MTKQEMDSYSSVADDLRRAAEFLKGDGIRPARIDFARRNILRAISELEDEVSRHE